jgi:hypothetical protein
MPTGTPEVPQDLIRLAEVLSIYKPSRSWWDARIAAGDITAYTVPGERGIFLSKAAVEAALQPRPYEKPERGAKEA